MKKVLFISSYIIFLGLAALWLNSCKDSLGIEDNVNVYLIDTAPVHHDPVTNKRFDAREVSMLNFMEYEVDRIDRHDTLARYPWPKQVDTAVAVIDTSGGRRTIWLTLVAENPKQDSTYNRTERVLAFSIELDSALAAGTYYPVNGFSSTFASSLTLQTLPNGLLYMFQGHDSPLIVQFTENTFDGASGAVKLDVAATLHSARQYLDLVFKGTIVVRYSIQ